MNNELLRAEVEDIENRIKHITNNENEFKKAMIEIIAKLMLNICIRNKPV